MMFENLRSLDDIRAHLLLAYQMTGGVSQAGRVRLGLPEGDDAYGKLPDHVANPAPLMARAVHLAGEDGISRQALLEVFDHLGQERLHFGLKGLAAMPEVDSETRSMPNKAGRLQRQTVYRWSQYVAWADVDLSIPEVNTWWRTRVERTIEERPESP